jgi:hypothetical protein
VFKSPVRSGILTLRDMDQDQDRSMINIKDIKTGLFRSEPVQTGFFEFQGLNRSYMLNYGLVIKYIIFLAFFLA